MKEEKKYTEEFKILILKQLIANRKSNSYLSKKYDIPKKLFSKWLSEFGIFHNNPCHKVYPTYKAHIENKKGTPYDSKLGGIPYVSEGQSWKRCPNCYHEMVLALQLNIQTLPEIPKGLEEWDFIQLYTCMYPHGSEKETEKCFQLEGYFGNHEEAIYVELIKKEKEAIEFESPLWIQGYRLEYSEASQHLLSYASEKVIFTWSERENITCVDGSLDWFSVHSNEEFSLKRLTVCTTGENTDLFGLLSYNELDNRASGVVDSYPECSCCLKPMVLLYQFVWNREEFRLHSQIRDGGYYENIYALFYCPEHPEMMICQWVNIYK